MLSSDLGTNYVISDEMLTIYMTDVTVPKNFSHFKIFIWDSLQNICPLVTCYEIKWKFLLCEIGIYFILNRQKMPSGNGK